MDQVDARGASKTLIHYVISVNPDKIACMPNMTDVHSTAYHPSDQRTNESRAVTCPACMKTASFIKERARYAQ